jgi:hypothetical protein
LTRVALPEGSLVVNSSQGGGSKDTLVLDHPRVPAAARAAAPIDETPVEEKPAGRSGGGGGGAQVHMRTPDPGPAGSAQQQQQQQ